MDVRDAGIERVESEQFRGTIRDLLFLSSLVWFSFSVPSPLRLERRRPRFCASSSRGIFPFLKRGLGAFLGGARKSFLSLSLEIARARTRRAIDFDAFAFFLLFHFRFRILTARTLSRFHNSSFLLLFYRPPMRVFPSFPGETAS